MNNGEHPAQRRSAGLQLIGAFESTHAGTLKYVFGVVLVPAQAKGESPQLRQHARQNTGEILDICCCHD